MRDDDLDRILSGEEDIVPSSGFTLSVMEEVTREASTPPPIAFPWKRAFPGLFCWVLLLAGIATIGFGHPGQATVTLDPVVTHLLWTVGAVVVSALLVLISLRMAGVKS